MTCPVVATVLTRLPRTTSLSDIRVKLVVLVTEADILVVVNMGVLPTLLLITSMIDFRVRSRRTRPIPLAGDRLPHVVRTFKALVTISVRGSGLFASTIDLTFKFPSALSTEWVPLCIPLSKQKYVSVRYLSEESAR